MKTWTFIAEVFWMMLTAFLVWLDMEIVSSIGESLEFNEQGAPVFMSGSHASRPPP